MAANLVRQFILYIYFTIVIRIYCYFYVYSLCNPNRFLYSVSFSHVCQPQIAADESMKDETPHTGILNFTHITISFYVSVSLFCFKTCVCFFVMDCRSIAGNNGPAESASQPITVPYFTGSDAFHIIII